MALRYIDGFDHYTSASQRGWSEPDGTMNISQTLGRRGGGCLTSGGRSVARTLDNQQDWTMGAAFFQTTNIFQSRAILTFTDGSTDQMELRLTNNLELQVTRNGTQLAISRPYLILAQRWFDIEFSVHIASGTSGSYTVRVDGSILLTATGVNTQASANAYANKITVRCPYSNNDQGYVDDLYVLDGTGTLTGALGNLAVKTLFPTGAGSTTQWTPSTGANYSAVNENPINSDTTYVSTNTVGNIDSYAMGDLTGGGTVYGLQTGIVSRYDDAVSTHTLGSVLHIGSTDYVGSALSVPSSYTTLITTYATSPATSSSFTTTEINGLEIGQKMLA